MHKTGNANTGKLKTLKNLNKYLAINKVCSGNSSGCSDITLQDKRDGSYIFISCKFPDTTKNNTKSLYDLDIQNIVAMVDDNKEIYKYYEIYLFVPNKNEILEKGKASKKMTHYLSKYVKENKILDKTDLNKCFLEFKTNILKVKKIYNTIDYNELYLTPQTQLKLCFHQELITRKTSNLIEEGNKSFLWGCKCRSGKTFMTGGIIIKEAKKKGKFNALIITPAPTETMPQFTEDLFYNFRDFNSFHNIISSKTITKMQSDENNIIIVSKQLLQKYIKDSTIEDIKKLKIDLIIFDENHFSGTTGLSKNILSSYSSKNTTRIYLTATYNKPLQEWNIPIKCQMYWDIEDEQFCKTLNITKLSEKHNEEYVKQTIQYYTNLGYTIDEIFKPYKNMPNLHLITPIFDQQRYEIIKNKIMDSKYGFSCDVLFSLNDKKTEFTFREDVKTILRYISGSNKEIDFKNGDKSIFTRISKISSRVPFTQIWFLPPYNINEISNCLITLTKEDNILKYYDVVPINRKNKELAKDVKDEINKKEIIARETNKRGLILLTGNMLSLRITIGSCDIVMLLNNTLSSDKIMQQMYRCMTEGKNKDSGFVVDLNISRVLNTCITYTIYKNNKSVEDKLHYLIKNHLINIDADMVEHKKLNVESIVSKLTDIWKSDPIHSFKSLLRNLDNDFVEFDNQTQKLLNKYFTHSAKDNTSKVQIQFCDSDGEVQELPSGKEQESSIDESKENITKEDKQTDNIISFTKDVLPYILPLASILTCKTNNKDFVKMLSDIKEDIQLLEIFDDQCLIWWNKNNLISFIQEVINKIYDKSSNLYNIAIQFKMSLQSLIDRPKELLELINECLKPKDVEKKQFGEVFTPMSLVNEMLDKLPLEVWKNKDLKWLDPAVGMGNFPIAVYLRLVESLSDVIEDKEERKKHILENMLYMCELNKKNVFVCKQIFDINNEYKLNIYEGDSLKLDYNKEFGVDKFDVIMGNPPYQDNSGNKGKWHTLWTRFVELSLNKLLSLKGFLVFVHPSLWRQPEHDMLKLLKIKQILYIEIHDEKDGQKTFKCSTRYDWYVLQNTIYRKDTEIKGQDRNIYNIDLRKWNFIPNYDFYKIEKLICGSIKTDIIYSRSAYGHDKKWVAKTNDQIFKYPVVYSVNRQNNLTLHYSSTNSNGHFGIPKVIFGSGATGFFIDKRGDYGLTQWCTGIADNEENLQKIKDAIESNEFKEVIKAISVSKAEINSKILQYFRKDFYTEFLYINNESTT